MRYRTIVVDPPWDHSDGLAGYNANPGKWTEMVVRPLPYGAMHLSEINDLPVANLADRDCRLFLWATNRFLPDAFGILTAWGFTYKQTLIWHKRTCSPLTGSVTYNAAEYLLVANRGNPVRVARWPGGCVISAPGNAGGDNRGHRLIRHSRKPDVFLDIAETVSQGPYLELFARRQRFGWDTWGDQALNHVEMPA